MKWIKIPAVLLVLFTFCLFIHGTDITKAFDSLITIGPRFFILLIITFFAYFLGTIGWLFCFEKERRKVTIKDLFFVRHVGETLALLNPTGVIGGEALKLYLLHQKGIAKPTVLTSLIVSRILMILTQLCTFGLVVCLLSGYTLLPQGSVAVLNTVFFKGLLMVTAVIFLFIPALWVIRRTKFYQLVNSRFHKLLETVRSSWLQCVQLFTHQKRDLILAILFFALHWIIGAVEFYAILQFMGLPCNLTEALFLDMGVVFFKTAGAFVPAQIGVEEYGNKVMLSLIGIADNEVWLTVSLLRRLRQLFWIICGLGMYAIIENKRKKKLAGGNIICQP